MTESVVWDTGKETVVSVEETKEMELFLSSEIVPVRRKCFIGSTEFLQPLIVH